MEITFQPDRSDAPDLVSQLDGWLGISDTNAFPCKHLAVNLGVQVRKSIRKFNFFTI
jgi:hypothetical protein